METRRRRAVARDVAYWGAEQLATKLFIYLIPRGYGLGKIVER